MSTRISRSALFLLLTGCADLLGMGKSRVAQDASLSDAPSTLADSSAETRDGFVDSVARDTSAYDATPDRPASTDDSDATDSAQPPFDSGTSDADADATETPPACDPDAGPDTGRALFVSPGSVAGDGTPAKPLGSVVEATMRAALLTDIDTIFLAEGIYEETRQVAPGSDLAIVGGLKNTAGAWRFDCAADARDKTIIKSATAVGVRITTGQVTLETLTVQTANGQTLESGERAGEGESTYGIWISGHRTSVNLHNVVVMAGRGGDGRAVTDVIAAPENTCPAPPICANGQSGATGGDGKDGQPGIFTENGYVAIAAEPGAVGQPGKAGTPGTAGPAASCVTSCEKIPPPTPTSSCSCRATSTLQPGPTGTCGCGGRGGAAGHAGFPGGASVGILVGQQASLHAVDIKVQARNGGDGSAGVMGQSGGSGTPGAPGATTTCPIGYCTIDLLRCATDSCVLPQTVQYLQGGSAGSAGGVGGKGGDGGHGGGGPSYGLVRLGLSDVTNIDFANIAIGTGGQNGGANSTAPAKKRLDLDVVRP